MSFDGEEYEKNRIIRQLLDIEGHATDGSAVLEGCSCIQDRHVQTLASAANQYGVIASKAENKEFGRQTSVYAEELLKKVYAFHAANASSSKDYTEKAWQFYGRIADEVREIRLAFEKVNSLFPIFEHALACGCKNCPPCNIQH